MEETHLPAYAALAAISLSVGFWVGNKRRSRSGASTLASHSPFSRATHSESTDVNHEDDDAEPTDGCKMVLVVRSDLGMSSGKIAAQCSHAALACYKTMLTMNPTMLRQWERAGQSKVALRCADEDELLLLQTQARSLNLCARSIQDAGRTQIAAGSRTVLGILGPARLVNKITGRLRLL